MTATTCACGKPVNDAYLCQPCTDCRRGDCFADEHRRKRPCLACSLRAVPAVRADLETSLARQTASGAREGGRSAEKPLPYDKGASDALEALGKALQRWAEVFGPGTLYRIDGAARKLLRRLGDLRQIEDAGKAAREIGDAVTAGRDAVDLRPERIYAGPCNGAGYTMRRTDAPDDGCGADLYAKPDARDVECKPCGTSYDVRQRREWMLEAAVDYLLPIPDLTRALPNLLGQPVNEATLRTWKHRGQLLVMGRRIDGERIVELFRVGDVIELVTKAQTRRKARVLDSSKTV